VTASKGLLILKTPPRLACFDSSVTAEVSEDAGAEDLLLPPPQAARNAAIAPPTPVAIKARRLLSRVSRTVDQKDVSFIVDSHAMRLCRRGAQVASWIRPSLKVTALPESSIGASAAAT